MTNTVELSCCARSGRPFFNADDSGISLIFLNSNEGMIVMFGIGESDDWWMADVIQVVDVDAGSQRRVCDGHLLGA